MDDKNNPPLDELADEFDEMDWDITKHGRFKDYIEEPPETELFYEGEVK